MCAERIPVSFRSASQANLARPDRLLRNAIVAYCALTRPGRREAEQLQDLALPLVDTAAPETLRYASAALSRCETEPEKLVARLADMEVEVAAPLLGRARSLTDIDLLNIISRHGWSHARVIASRDRLHPSIKQLTETVERRQWQPTHPARPAAPPPQPTFEENLLVEETRDRLRTIMKATVTEDSEAAAHIDYIYEELRDSALAGSADQVAAALANALGVLVPLARTIARDDSLTMLIPALRALNLADEEAYLITSAIHPARFGSATAIRAFLRSYRSMAFEAIEAQLTRWQETGAAVTATARRSA